MKTIQLFCARCNGVTTSELSAVSGEFIATCQTEGCGHTVKFPEVATSAELQAMIDQHNADNKPAVTLADLQSEEQPMLDALEGL